MDKTYNVTCSEKVQLGRFTIVLDSVEQNGKVYPYSYVDQKKSVGVLGMIDDKIILVRQYRHSLKSYEYEIPGGGIELGEKPLDVASRELLEETGYRIKRIDELGSYYPSPGSSNEICFLFFAECEKGESPQREPLEYMDTELLRMEDFVEMVRNGSFKHSMGLVAWLRYCLKQGVL